MSVIRRDVVEVEARNAEIGLLLGMLDAGTQNARRELGEVAEEAIVWQPYPNGHSIGAILIHLAACEASWLHQVVAGQDVPDLETQWMDGAGIDQYAGIWPAPPAKPLSWYYGLQDEVRVRTRELIGELPDPDVFRTVTWSPDRECTVRWILHHIIEHEAYHIGQAILLSLERDRMTSANDPLSSTRRV